MGNDAAHGDFDKYDAESVRNMVAWIGETLLSLEFANIKVFQDKGREKLKSDLYVF